MTKAAARSALAGLLLLVGCLRGPTQLAISPDGSVTVEAIEIPADFGAFAIADVEEYEFDEAGTMVRYAPHDSVRNTLPILDLFVYPAGSGRLETHAEQARRELQSAAGNVRGVHSVQVSTMERMPPARGVHPIFLTPARMNVAGNELRSLMYISRVGERYLKVRISYPAALGYGWDDTLHAQVRLLFADIVRRSES